MRIVVEDASQVFEKTPIEQTPAQPAGPVTMIDDEPELPDDEAEEMLFALDPSRTRTVIADRNLVGARVDAALKRTWIQWWCPSEKEEREDIDGIADVETPVVVRVACISTGRTDLAEKLATKDVNRICEIDHAVVVSIAPKEKTSVAA